MESRTGMVGTARRVGVVAALVVVGSLWALEADAQEAVDGEFERLVDIIEGPSESVEQLAAAHLVGELRPFLVPSDYVARLDQAADKVDDPLLEFALRRQAMRAALEGEIDDGLDNDTFSSDQSCLVDWKLVGPFDNPSMQGFEQRLGPETGEVGPFDGRHSQVDWRPLSTGHHLCVYQLNRWVQPSTSAVAYLSTTIEADEAGDATLLVGSRGAYRIWVNGEPVGQRTAELGLGLDAEGWNIELSGGENEILVKLGSSGQGGLSWTARLIGANHDDNWSTQAGVEAGDVAPFEEVGMPDGGARMLIEDVVASDENQSAQARVSAAMLWKTLYSDDGSTPWRDVAQQLAADAGELSAREMVWLSRLYEDLWQQHAILDQALGRDDSDRLLRWQRARTRGETLSHIEWEAQRRELESLVDEAPGFLMAVESLTQWFREHDGAPGALRVLERYDDEQRTSTPAWIQLVSRLHAQAGNKRQAAEYRKQAAAVHQLTGTFGWTLFRESMAGGDSARAREIVAGYRQRAPWSKSWGLREATLLRTAGEFDDALSVVDVLIAQSPGDAQLRKRRAELLAAAGDIDGAMAAAGEAIALRPQATRYQDYLEHLQPESSRFYESWVIGDIRAIDDQTPRGSQNWDMLVDQRVQQVASNGLASRFEQRAHRVLRDEGVSGARQMRISYRPGDERVEVLGVRVLKADGTLSEDYDDWRTSRTRQGGSTYNDRAYTNMRANNVDVGDVVEFRYVVHQVANENFRGDYFGDVRYVQRTRPVARARYAVLYPTDWELFFRAPKLEHQRVDNRLPNGDPVQDQKSTFFELTEVPRVYTEDNRPGHTDVYDHVLVSNKETYDEVGAWWWELIEEQMVVDDAIRQKVAEVTDGLDTDRQKLEAIHEYVVRNTRYLHLGLGIHGWKPYRTSTVFRNRYGDCKDKAALLKVMLEEVGIEAQMVLVRTRRLGTVDDLPASMHLFNHAVTYVPSMDLFIDPTAQYNGPYELTQMDQGAQALIVADGGQSRFVRMPVDKAEDNLQREVLEVDLRPEVPVVSGRIEAHGANAVRDRRRFEDGERRNELFEDRLRSQFLGLELLDAEYEGLDKLTEPTRIRYTANFSGALQGSDDSKAIYPYVTPRSLLDRYARQSTRRQDLTFRVPFVREAEVRYRLPEQMTVERLPESRQGSSPFGSFDVSYERDGDELVARIRYAIEVQRVAVDDYSEFRRFVASMDEALNETIRLVDKQDV